MPTCPWSLTKPDTRHASRRRSRHCCPAADAWHVFDSAETGYRRRRRRRRRTAEPRSAGVPQAYHAAELRKAAGGGVVGSKPKRCCTFLASARTPHDSALLSVQKSLTHDQPRQPLVVCVNGRSVTISSASNASRECHSEHPAPKAPKHAPLKRGKKICRRALANKSQVRRRRTPKVPLISLSSLAHAHGRAPEGLSRATGSALRHCVRTATMPA